MENFSYHVPFFVVNGGVDLSGHCSDLNAGQVGIFDRSTFSVATSAGSGKEFFFAQGNNGGLDWYGQKVTESHKSPFFYGKDVENMYVALPQKLQNEEWVIGFNGAASSKGLTYETGKPVRVKFYFHGQPTYRFFGGPKEYVVSYTPPVGCDAPCAAGDCPDPIVDSLVHTQALIDAINTHTELKKFGVQAKLVSTPYTAGTTNVTKYTLTLTDDGDALALQYVKNSVGADFRANGYAAQGFGVTRISRSGAISVYEVCSNDGAPSNFQQTAPITLAVCNDCPSGSTLVAATDSYIISRPLAGSENLVGATAQDNYADTVGGEYATSTATTISDAAKVFISNDGAVAKVKITVVAGTVVAALKADSVEFAGSVADQCTFTDPSSIAWVEGAAAIRSSRTLKIKALQRLDCSGGDRLDDLTSILAGVKGVNIGTLTKIAGVNCADDYTVVQDSNDCLDEACLTNNVSFTYDTLPAFESKPWEVVPVVPASDPTRKTGIRINAGYVDPKNGNTTFDVTSYFEIEPVKFELSLLQEDGSACDFASLPSVQQTKFGKVSRQSGEYVIREVIYKDAAYQKHIAQFSNDPLMREKFDINIVQRVDRNAFYKLYYITYKASYGKSYRKNEQETFTTVFAFKEDSKDAAIFEANVISVLQAKSQASFHVNS